MNWNIYLCFLSFLDNIILKFYLPLCSSDSDFSPYVYYSSGDNPSDPTNLRSPPSLTYESSAESSSDSEEEIDEAGIRLGKKYKDNPEGFSKYLAQRRENISQKYTEEVQRVESNRVEGNTDPLEVERERNLLREIRDERLNVLDEKAIHASNYIKSQRSETDDDNLSFERPDTPGSVKSSNENSTNNNEPSGSEQPSSTSATGSTFRQDTSDILPDTEPMDFDDPTG